MKQRIRLFLRLLYDLRLQFTYLATFFVHRLPSDHSDVIVSMTSYPARIRGAWVSLESLFRQNFRPFTLVLVLAEAQFPGKKLPLMIRLMIRKGLKILWVKEDNRSWDHLWPAYAAYPDASIISVDDDKVFPTDLVRVLVEASQRHPGTIIGSRGWEMRLEGQELRFGEGWVRANLATPSHALFIPPGNGSLYPPNSLPQVAGDTQLMRDVCPRADDVWYWGMARIAGTPSVCLGMDAHRSARPQSRTRALADEDPGPAEFGKILERFGHEALRLRKSQLLPPDG